MPVRPSGEATARFRGRGPRSATAVAGPLAVLGGIAVMIAACPSAGPGRQVTRARPLPASASPTKELPYPGADRPGRAPAVHVILSRVDREQRARVRVRDAYVVSPTGGQPVYGDGLDAELRLDTRPPAFGGMAVPSAGLWVHPRGDAPVQVGERAYPGSLRIAPDRAGRLRAFIVSDIETYLAGVLAGELPARFPPESHRAQAIAARTYALAASADRGLVSYLVVTDTGREDQEFVGLPPAFAARIVEAAVESTRGMVLTEDGRPIRAWYHSTCGGETCPGAVVFGVPPTGPLAGVACGRCETSKYYRWSGGLDGTKVARAAGLEPPLTAFRIATTTRGGRAITFDVEAGGARRRVDAVPLRLALDPGVLRSVWLDDIRIEGGKLHVAGRGWGHGVGLCQIGAKERAADGDRAEEILAHYYPGARLETLW